MFIAKHVLLLHIPVFHVGVPTIRLSKSANFFARPPCMPSISIGPSASLPNSEAIMSATVSVDPVDVPYTIKTLFLVACNTVFVTFLGLYRVLPLLDGAKAEL